MAWQLIYTSAPLGLAAGRSGFCTVARHAEIRERLVAEIERCSAYDLPPGGARPIIASHRLLDIGGTRYHLLSRIRDAGLDYTGRTSHIAHHLVCDEQEIRSAASPAQILRSFPWTDTWTESPRFLGPAERVNLQSVGQPLHLPARYWAQLTGRADNAALLAQHIGMPGCVITCAPGREDSLLCLFEESLLLLNPDGRNSANLWSVRFTTWLQPSDNPADFDWRGAWTDNGAAVADRLRCPLLDISRGAELPRPKDPGMIRFAETGVPPATRVQLQQEPAARSSTATEGKPRVQLQASEIYQRPARVAATAANPERNKRRNRALLIGAAAGIVLLALVGIVLAVAHFWKPRTPLAITAHPADQSIREGDSATFGVAATGTPPFTYEWVHGSSRVDHATGSVLRISRVQKNDGGDYTVWVRDRSGGCVISKPARLEVEPPPDATVSGGGTIVPGGRTELRVTLTGAPPWTIVWSDGHAEDKIKTSPHIREVSPAVTTTYTIRNLQDAKGSAVEPRTSSQAKVIVDKQSAVVVTNMPQDVVKTSPKTNAPSDVVKTPPPKTPDDRDALPKAQSYIVVGNLADGVNLDLLFKGNKMGISKIQSKDGVCISITNRWTSFPDAGRKGEGMAVSAPWNESEGQLKLNAGMRPLASLTGAGVLTRGTDPWLAAAIRFQQGDAAIQVVLVDQSVANTPPFPPFEMSRKKWCDGSGKTERIAVKKDFLQLLPRNGASPNGTKYRLSSSKLLKLEPMVRGCLDAIVSLQGDVSGEAAIDCRMIKDSFEEALKAATATAEKPAEIPNQYLTYIQLLPVKDNHGLNQQSFREHLKKTKLSGDPWSDFVDYCRPYLAQAAKDHIKPYLQQCKGHLQSRKAEAENKRQDTKWFSDRINDIDDRLQELETFSSSFDHAKTNDWNAIKYVGECLSKMARVDVGDKNVGDKRKTAIREFTEAWGRIFSDNNYNRIAQERTRFAIDKSAMLKEVEQQAEARKRTQEQLKKMQNKIPKDIKGLGDITLDMEVAPNVWWPIVKFTEGGQ